MSSYHRNVADRIRRFAVVRLVDIIIAIGDVIKNERLHVEFPRKSSRLNRRTVSLHVDAFFELPPHRLFYK